LSFAANKPPGKSKERELRGWNVTLLGPDMFPPFANASKILSPILGFPKLTTTKVVCMDDIPEPSEALKVKEGEPTSAVPGIPESWRLAESRLSQAGASARVYWKDSSFGVNVVGEKVKLNSSPTRATGGTWELRGKATSGAAIATAMRQNRKYCEVKMA